MKELKPDLGPSTQSLSGEAEASVAAVIILYHPDLLLLDRLLESLVDQVDSTYVIDNTPASQLQTCPVPAKYQTQVHYRPLGENQGIATAQNTGIREAMQLCHTHVLLLDQDSALPEDMVGRLLQAESALKSAGQKVAAIGPVFVDEKSGEFSPAIRAGYFLVKKIEIHRESKVPVASDHLIASGSLLSAQSLSRIGLMRDDLFIDWVDIEWGLRAKELGYTSFVCPNVLMRHSIGDSTVRIMGRSITLHNDVRNFYIVRNAAFLLRLKYLGWKWRSAIAMKIPRYVVYYSLHSDHPGRCFRLLARGCLNGMLGKLGRLD